MTYFDKMGNLKVDAAPRMDWEFVVGRSRLLHLEWINNKVLMYSTENYIQYTVINHNGKEYRKRIYVISESVVRHSVVFDSLQLHGL